MSVGSLVQPVGIDRTAWLNGTKINMKKMACLNY